MAIGDLVSADWQMEFAGLALGDGSPYLIAQANGLLDLPNITVADRTRLRRHGMIAGDDFANGRSVLFNLEVHGDTEAEFEDALDALMEATAPGQDEQPLVLQIPGVAGGNKVRINARPRRRSLPVGREFYYRLPIAALEFFATDPRIYSNTLSSDSTTLPTAGGGLEFDLEFPALFGAVSTSGTLNLVNAGTFRTSPTITITGPVSNPRIESLTQDKTLEFAITLAGGETLVIDTEYRTVLLNGTASRYNTITAASEWFDLAPGTNEVRFQASTSSAALMTITWRSAWV